MIVLPNFKKRRENTDPSGHRVPVDVAAPAAQSTAEKLANLLERADRVTEQLRGLENGERVEQLATLEARLAGLSHSIGIAERLATQLADADSRAARLLAASEKAETEVTAADAEIDRIRSNFGELGAKVEAALSMREQLERFGALQTQFAALRSEGETTGGHVREMTEQVARLRSVHDDALRAHQHTISRLDGIDRRFQMTATKVEAIERRAAAAEQALEALLNIASGIPDVQHKLGVLKAIADQVMQRTAAVEQQREAVERAAAQASHVIGLSSQVEVALRRQDEQARAINALDTKLNEVQGRHVDVLARSEEIAAQQRQLDETEKEAARALISLRDEMRASMEHFELENRSLDAVTERIADLRTGLKECEGRLASLESVSGAVAATDAHSQAVAFQVATIAEDVGRISAQAERLRAVRDDVGELDKSLAEMSERMQRVETMRPGVEVAVRDLSSLNGAREAVRDGLEQMRTAIGEMARVRDGQTATDAWLRDADGRMRSLQTQVSELEQTRPSVDALRRDVERVTGSLDALEARGEAVETLRGRLGELESQTARLIERSEDARTRMESAESQFAELSRQAAEAERVASSIASTTVATEAAGRRLDAVSERVDTMEARVQKLGALGERMRILGQELEQRQGALEAAAEHLDRASTMRREAAEAAQHLEELAETISGQLTDATSKSEALEELVHGLDDRATALGDVDARLTNFEALLRKWDVAHGQATLALEQILSRQGMIDAVQTRLGNVSDIAERTADSVRSITSSRREIEETRAVVEITRAELKSATEAMRDFAERKRQVEELERRLARAEALTTDVRSTMEAIGAQRAIVDQVLERSGTLAFQIKQADAAAEALRAECTLATQIRSAVSELREPRGEEVAAEAKPEGKRKKSQ